MGFNGMDHTIKTNLSNFFKVKFVRLLNNVVCGLHCNQDVHNTNGWVHGLPTFPFPPFHVK